MRISRIRLSERGQRRHTQGNSGSSESEPEQTPLPQLPLLTDAFRRTAAPLTALEQMLPQTMPEVTIELVEGSAWKAEAEVVRPPSAVPVQFRIQPRQRLETVPPIRHLMQDCPFPLLGLLRGKHIRVPLTATEQVPVAPKRVPQEIEAGSGVRREARTPLPPVAHTSVSRRPEPLDARFLAAVVNMVGMPAVVRAKSSAAQPATFSAENKPQPNIRCRASP